MGFLKKYFISHKENNHHPHFFRMGNLVVFLLIILLLFAVTVSSRLAITKSDYLAAVLSHVLVDLTNDDREAYSVPTLTRSALLDEAARLKAEDMVKNGYFAHKSPSGLTPWHWFKEVGYAFTYAGENLAVNYGESIDVNKAWLNSPPHRANLLNKHFTEIGMATAEGYFEGRPTVFVVQLFGRPAPREINANVLVGDNQKEVTLSEEVPVTISPASQVVLGEAKISDMAIAPEVDSRVPTATSPRVSQASIGTFLFSPGKILILVYLCLSLLIIFALTLFLFFEIQKHHIRHILFALLLLVLMGALMYVYRVVLFSPILVI
mgnify:CR=1 FL=1